MKIVYGSNEFVNISICSSFGFDIGKNFLPNAEEKDVPYSVFFNWYLRENRKIEICSGETRAIAIAREWLIAEFNIWLFSPNSVGIFKLQNEANIMKKKGKDWAGSLVINC